MVRTIDFVFRKDQEATAEIDGNRFGLGDIYKLATTTLDINFKRILNVRLYSNDPDSYKKINLLSYYIHPEHVFHFKGFSNISLSDEFQIKVFRKLK
ncbi:hypothetical protein COT60_01885 [Candidatus Pacearchaeota archaeon CG09_land_8_20_14_0_10_30_9]|nr:hypothetical protein [Candidatus Pacearchaeota archaeon]OIO40195.1 MAG: hypothetical protein AUJ61_02290 [Candidatus Pacearchaeota archaeon CG1_02_30_18]PIN71310.1 MAG: hypothetical protein COV77_02615 [Candidatus Pacearchaeota archaeon CG11_big_fil_rev_8_21_14_0_20_30_13]PIO01165.1 MAG: hypothetical protein COT60_01885 [Candidatus Pacearchaeota archaeon CG09_land_8_20_14_0_10_30_9]PJA71595.1 MAG: hypothetical protein CO153_00655 [Candidatus Pacearchaeota archaeon CG_4_9_14_3_um_filter_30_11